MQYAADLISSPVEKDGEVLPEEIPPQKLIQLKTKDGQHIACSAISSHANWMSYSDIDGFKLYEITMVGSWKLVGDLL